MSSPSLPDALPFGIRQIMLTPYVDSQGTVLGPTSYPLPVAMTLGFSESEKFATLEGDDKIVAVHGTGAQVDWSLEAGGINFAAWSIISGAAVVEEGVSPTRTRTLQKSYLDQRPYFRIDGRAISDSGGNIVARIYRAKANGKIQANHKSNSFQTSQIDGIGLPLIDDENAWLYELIQNEDDTPLAWTPNPNPVPVPANVYVDVINETSVTLVWTDVVTAQGYVIQQSTDGGNTWADVAAGQNDVQTLTMGGSPTGGTFTLTSGGDTTTSIPYDATAAQVQSALGALASIGPWNVEVSGEGPWVVTFIGELANTDMSAITATSSDLTGGTSPAVTIAHTTSGETGGGEPADNWTIIDGLTQNTAYQWQVAAVVNDVIGDYGSPVGALTLTS